jgi:hypothetical protein
MYQKVTLLLFIVITKITPGLVGKHHYLPSSRVSLFPIFMLPTLTRQAYSFKRPSLLSKTDEGFSYRKQNKLEQYNEGPMIL